MKLLKPVAFGSNRPRLTSSILLCLLVAIAPAISVHAVGQGLAVTFQEIGPPIEDRGSINLSGRSDNPNTETWMNIQGSEWAPWGWTGPLIVRNVSQATLTPFLPDPLRATGAAMIVAPGGGTLELSMGRQGYEVARWLNQRGIAAFVLKYRLVPTPKDTATFLKLIVATIPHGTGQTRMQPVISAKQASEEAIATHEDGLEAIRYVRSHALQWNLSTDRIGIMGFSAGAFTSIGVALDSDRQSQPNLVAAIYGAMPEGLTVSASAPPAFIAASSDDPVVPSMQSVRSYAAWQEANVPVELHIFATGGHGFGVTHQAKDSDQWLDLFDHWLRDRGFRKKGAATRR